MEVKLKKWKNYEKNTLAKNTIKHWKFSAAVWPVRIISFTMFEVGYVAN